MKKLLLVVSVATLGVGLLALPLSAQNWPNHKMHWPQLPDLIGWDVRATSNFPPPGYEGIMLADDWQCSRSGPIEDIHFWGSWKDQDGDPTTDDFESVMPWFTLRIWSNDPGPPSKPDSILWQWYGEIAGVPSEPITLEGWYEPLIPQDVFHNDHIPYWRYDFFVPPGYPVFVQEQDSIYWLSITANLFNPAAYQWGWKNSRNHFMDNAVCRVPGGMWQSMDEPPRYNIFHGYFDGNGQAWEDSMSTNFWGDGWYFYPSGWWNIWFYDNPFTLDNTKNIIFYADVQQYGPNPSIVFALNYTTPLWSQEGVPGRPPLPEDFPSPVPPVPEEQYIVRDTVAVVIGSPDFFTFTLPYNPEWVSIDVIATDVTVDGWIEHECYTTSLDLAFVITGPEEEIPTLNEWGMLILALLLLAAGTVAVVSRKRKVLHSKSI